MNYRRRKAKLLAQVTLKTWNGGGFGDRYFEREGAYIVKAVERALLADVWWRRLLRALRQELNGAALRLEPHLGFFKEK
jgi:hypothetical protein